MEINYRDIFSKIERSLREYSSLDQESFLAGFRRYNEFTFSKLSDEAYFNIMKMVVFYSGFSAVTVDNREASIDFHLPDYESVMSYNDQKISFILSDSQMIKNRSKVLAVTKNARAFSKIIRKYGSFHEYIDSFSPIRSFENLMLLKEELQYSFDYFGETTVYHFLTDIGLPVIKPDRVITRIFKRLAIIESEKQLLKTIIQGRKFAEATNNTHRYVDIVFVKYGQEGRNKKFLIEDGICLEHNPKCNFCQVSEYCEYYKTQHTIGR